MTRLLCLGVWALIVVFAVPTVMVHRPSPCSYAGGQVRLCFESFGDRLWQGRLLPLVLLAEALGFLLPLAAMLYSSGRVFWTLARPNATQSQRRRKTVRLLLANLVIFLLCFVPYNATLAVYGLLRGNLVAASGEACDRVRQVLMVMVLLAGANCVLDPLVYYFSAEGFRNTLRGLGTPHRGRTLAANGGQGALAQQSTETTLITSTAPASQGLLRPSNLGTPLT